MVIPAAADENHRDGAQNGWDEKTNPPDVLPRLFVDLQPPSTKQHATPPLPLLGSLSPHFCGVTAAVFFARQTTRRLFVGHLRAYAHFGFFFCQSYVKLLIRDVHGLGTLGGIDDSHVLHGNKAIHRVEVSGVVVHVKPGATKASGSYGERSWER